MIIINIDRYSLTKQSLIIGEHTIKEHQNSLMLAKSTVINIAKFSLYQITW